MPSFSLRIPMYQKMTPNEKGVLEEPSGASLGQLLKAASRDEPAGPCSKNVMALPDNRHKRSAQIFNRARRTKPNLAVIGDTVRNTKPVGPDEASVKADALIRQRRRQLFARMEVNVKDLSKYVSCNSAGDVRLTKAGVALVEKDNKKKRMAGVIQALTAPTVIGALAVYKGYVERRDKDKYAATDVTPALQARILAELGAKPTRETLEQVADKYGVAQYDLVAWAGLNPRALYNFPPAVSNVPPLGE